MSVRTVVVSPSLYTHTQLGLVSFAGTKNCKFFKRIAAEEQKEEQDSAEKNIAVGGTTSGRSGDEAGGGEQRVRISTSILGTRRKLRRDVKQGYT